MDERLKTETVEIRPKRIFQCKQENRIMPRSGVKKWQDGSYHCSSCGGVVEDKTNSETGKELLRWL